MFLTFQIKSDKHYNLQKLKTVVLSTNLVNTTVFLYDDFYKISHDICILYPHILKFFNAKFITVLFYQQWGYSNFAIADGVNNFAIATFPIAFNNYTAIALALDILNNDATEYKPIHVLTWSKFGDTKNNIKFVTDDGNSVQAIGYFVIGK